MIEEREIQRILVVDDEPGICMMVVEFLQSCGYHCESTTDPVKSLSILRHGKFELLISDIKMAGFDGIQLVREVSKMDCGIDTIFMTGYTEDYTYSDTIKAGAADFIAKPFRNPELTAKIERIDRERKMRRELQEMNVALRVLLRQAEREKEDLRATIAWHVEESVLPYLDRLKNDRLSAESMACLDMVESNLHEISSVGKNPSLRHANLSPMEVQVANLIKAGKRSKEIASILGVSLNTVMTHRYSLRSKLAIRGRNVNLRSYLNSPDFQ